MKTRSKALHAYLSEAGVLNGTAEDVDGAKREYRKQYKRQWKQNKKPRKELRIGVTLKQFAAVNLRAREYGLRHTTYARKAILADAESKPMIPGREMLEKTLQLVSMAAIGTLRQTLPLRQVSELLEEAERILFAYLETDKLKT